MHRQKGMTLVGLMFFSILLIFFAYTAFRLSTAYLNYWTVKRALVQMAADASLAGQGEMAYRDAFEKRLRLNDISIVDRRDLVIEPGQNGAVRLSAAWTERRPFIGAVNLCLDFKADSSSEP